MTEFEASNGYKVQCTENDLFIKSPDDPIFICVPGNANIQALREFFAQERQEELPFRHGDSWVFPLSMRVADRRVRVVGADGGTETISESSANRYISWAHDAAQAWFVAHPKAEPKPWLDAQTGEVWSISDVYDDGGLAVCRREPEHDSDDDHPIFYGPDFDGVRGDDVISGKRLEVQS